MPPAHIKTSYYGLNDEMTYDRNFSGQIHSATQHNLATPEEKKLLIIAADQTSVAA